LIFFAGYPLYQLVLMSVSRVTSADILSAWPPAGGQNYRSTFGASEFGDALTNTFFIVLILLIVGLVGGTLASLSMRTTTFPVRATLAVMVLVWTLPGVVVGTLWKFLLARDGAINNLLRAVHVISTPVPWLVHGRLALWSIALVSSWFVLPFSTLVLRAALLDVPQDQLEAAAIDGAGPINRFATVILPHIRPTLYVMGALMVVNGFRTFDLIYVMTTGGPGTATVTLPFLAYRQAFQQFQFGLGAATAVFSIGLVMVVAAIYGFGNRQRGQG
jgi:multiple sugar transport system permease protein